ncbi:MAG: CHAT domain-containing protein [Moorea sp. SIOASIH]|uniref:CHAT domain-containing protein n=1 Tax=Moorena sp. SIOASIH TaxID=2607817 RepID=UPI0013BC2042|nr:CHAT domain-containing protein [Moorena sp. SIOASIH]NEO38177.1 CHAT domain-containing protein [Moorena sp. SIOASIH]
MRYVCYEVASSHLDKLVNWVNRYWQAYYTKKTDWQNDLSNRLHRLAEILHIDDIIKQIAPECDRLILIPHQVFHWLPLHALPINSKQGEATSEILIDHFPAGVSYAPSCQLLQLVETRKRQDFTHLFAVQNPTGDLSYANIEVEVIKRYFNPADTDVLVENAATKDAIDSKALNTYHCLHFSSHGYFNLEQPQKSALILADAYLNSAPVELNPAQHLDLGNDKVLDLDKCLTLDAIFALKSEQKLAQCRLVTLSACETGLVQSKLTDEYVGLTTGFLVAGSPAVLSSLWKVDDLSTALLMIKFYQNLLNQMSLAVALNQAQLWLRDATVQELRDWAEQLTKELNLDTNFNKKIKKVLRFFNSQETPFKSPYYWAAYCAIGQ